MYAKCEDGNFQGVSGCLTCRSDFLISRHRFRQLDPNMQPTDWGMKNFNYTDGGYQIKMEMCTVPHFCLYVYARFDTAVL